jgi:hypothetical protein
MICHLHYCNRDECEALHTQFSSAQGRSDGIGAPAVIVFQPAVFEHIYDQFETPRVIETPQELRRECARRGVTSEYLANSGIWRSGPERWV